MGGGGGVYWDGVLKGGMWWIVFWLGRLLILCMVWLDGDMVDARLHSFDCIPPHPFGRAAGWKNKSEYGMDRSELPPYEMPSPKYTLWAGRIWSL